MPLSHFRVSFFITVETAKKMKIIRRDDWHGQNVISNIADQCNKTYENLLEITERKRGNWILSTHLICDMKY